MITLIEGSEEDEVEEESDSVNGEDGDDPAQRQTQP